MRTTMSAAGLLACAGLLCVGCTSARPAAVGPLREVTVVSDYWDRVDSTVFRILQEPVLTPQPEPEFKVRVGSADRFEAFSRFRIVLLIGVPQDTLLRQILGRRVDSLSEGDYGLLKVPNAWQRDQFALIFIARDTSRLVPGLIAYGPRIRHTLREIVLGQMTSAVYYGGFDRDLSRQFGEGQSFSMDVPRYWAVNRDAVDSGFVYMFGHVPDRTVSVHWEDAERALDPDSIVVLRDRLTGRYFEGDSVEPSYTRVDTISFLTVPCVRLTGVWQNRKQVIGGPFVSYAFNFQGRFYLLDGLVFNPGKPKLNALEQVEAAFRTFVPR
jgi:hypothetical protein